jgi:hypothetical protein
MSSKRSRNDFQASIDHRNVPVTETSRSVRRKDIWEHFYVYESSYLELQNVAVCKHCYEMYINDTQVPSSVWEAYISNHSPTHLKDHLMYKHKSIYSDMVHNNILLKHQECEIVLDPSPKSKQFHVRTFAKMCVDASIPISLCENDSYKAHIHGYNNYASHIDRHTVKEELQKISAEVREVLPPMFEGEKVSITNDTWTSR